MTLVPPPVAKPAPPPAWLAPLLGQYGDDEDGLVVLEQGGQGYVLVEYEDLLPLVDHGGGRYAAGPGALARSLEFESAGGEVVAVRLAGRRHARAHRDADTFRVEPLLPEAELRRRALAADPPRETGKRAPELVEIVALEPSIRLDLRYGTTDNFLGMRFYERPRALLQRPAAEALGRVAASLRAKGYGLWVFDAYRPWHVTRMFWDATPEHLRHFVADPASGSRHNRGCAIDLTLYELATGRPVAMPSGFDEFTPRAYATWPGGSTLQRWHRALLRDAMAAEGFEVYEFEWWHFDHAGWREYPVLDEAM